VTEVHNVTGINLNNYHTLRPHTRILSSNDDLVNIMVDTKKRKQLSKRLKYVG